MLINLTVNLRFRTLLAAAAAVVSLFGGTVDAQTGNVASGLTLYESNCFSCHGSPRFSSAGQATTVAKLNNALNSINVMKDLFNSGAFFSNQEKADIVAYIVSQVSGPTQQSQTITFLPINAFNAGGAGTALAATASSGLAVTYAVISGQCILAGNQLTSPVAGACTVRASQAGNTNFNAAPPVSNSVTVLPPIPLAKRGGVDIDGDGRGEIFVRNAAGLAQIGRLNTTTGQFVFTPASDPGTNFRYVGLFDFAGNGRSDLAFQDVTQGEFGEVFVLNEFVPGVPTLLRTVKRVWDVQAVGDLDGDGFGDLVWRYLGFTPERPGVTGVSYIWFSNGVGGPPVVRKRGGAPLNWQLLGAADLDGNGAADMVYVSPDNQVRVLMATAQRTCANFVAGAIPTGFTAIKLADFSGNGRAQILIRNATTGAVQLHSLDATGIVLPQFTADPDDPNASCTATTVPIGNSLTNLPATDPTITFYAADDFDGDGRFDIVWRTSTGTLVTWKMTGTATPIINNNAGTAPAGFQPTAPAAATSPPPL